MSIALSAGTASVVQGAAASPVTVTVTRGGGFTGAVALSVTGAPAGMTAAFTPTSVGTGTTTSTLNVTTTAALAAGTYPLTVRATGAGVTDQTATLTVTVTPQVTAGDFTIAMSPTTLTLPRGGSATTTVTITRTGAFTGPVNVGVRNLPAGVTATINGTPALMALALSGAQADVSVPGATATIVVSAGATAAAGSFTLTVAASAPGIAEKTLSASTTVTAPPAGSVSWSCAAGTWLAVQDGTGPWTQVVPSGTTYSFNITAARGGVAWVRQESPTSYSTYVFYGTKDEIAEWGTGQCTNVAATGGKTVIVPVTGIGTGQSASVALGGASGSASANGNVTLNNVADGALDLAGARSTLNLATFTVTPDRLFLRRGVNAANGSPITAMDFNSATEAFAPATATITIANGGGDQLAVGGGFVSATGASVGLYQGLPAAGGTTRTFYGFPTARLNAGDRQYASVTAIGNISGTNVDTRMAMQYFRETVDRTITLGPAVASPSITFVGGTRFRAQAGFQAEYDKLFTGTCAQGNATSQQAIVAYMTAGYKGAGNWDLTMPDLSGVAGFPASSSLRSGVQASCSVGAMTYSTTGSIAPTVENAAVRIGLRTFTQTP